MSTSLSQPLRVVHVIPNLGLGGAERVVTDLLRFLDRSRYSPLLCVLGSENALPSRLRGIESVVFLGVQDSLLRPKGFLKAARRLRRVLRVHRPEVVHSHLWPAARVAAVASAGLGIRHLVHIHDTRPWLESKRLRYRFLRLVTRVMLRLSDTSYVAVSGAVKEHACSHLAIPCERVRVIHNGVDLDVFQPRVAQREKHDGIILVGMAGRLCNEKGCRYLLEAAADLSHRGFHFQLRLAGDGPGRAQYEELAAALGISKQLCFLGLVEDVPGFLQELDVFVLPSLLGEGLPMVILEAMATGVPVIATRIAGAPEVITHGDNGMLVPPADAGALARAVLELAGNEAKRRDLGRRAVATVRDRFSIKRCTRQVEAVYRELAGEQRA